MYGCWESAGGRAHGAVGGLMAVSEAVEALVDTLEHLEAAGRSAAERLASQPTERRPGDARFVALARSLGSSFAAHAGGGDESDHFHADNFDALRAAGYLALGVPTELGGAGASIAQLCHAQAELARHCASTALAVAMHLHLTLSRVWRWRRGDADAGAVLGRVAQDGLVLVTSAGSDGLFPMDLALPDEAGGYRLSGRKRFCSAAPAGGLLSGAAFTGEYELGSVVEFDLPMPLDGVTVTGEWAALGMRGTGSCDVVLDDVHLPGAAVQGRRQWGQLGPGLRLTLVHMNLMTSAVYYGIAAGARDVAVAHARSTSRGAQFLADTPEVRRQVGLMDYDLRLAWWSIEGAIDSLGDDYEADAADAAVVGMSRRCVTEHAGEVVELAMDVVGGASYLRGAPLERAYRDVRAARYHSPTPESALRMAGKVALGRGCHAE